MGDIIKTAVIGTGALGQHHARIHSELAAESKVEFAGVFDKDHARAESVSSKLGAKAFSDFDQLLNAADAFSVVTPTITHFDIAKKLLEAGKHVLVEKPMTQTTGQAGQLVDLAEKHQVALQVGHVERFNPVYGYLQEAAARPRFIEAHRLSPFPARSTDIGVVLDLMIHDIDIILAFVDSPVESVDAVGIPILSESEDIANVRLKFKNGCVANITASRVSPERMRKIRVFSSGDTASYVSLDFMKQEGYLYRLGRAEEKESSLLKKLLSAKDSAIVSEFAGRKIVREPVPIERAEPLRLEIESFVDCVNEKRTPLVCGASAKKALDLALEITRQIEAAKSHVDEQ
ncbi:Gfo/Idh/MocA family oxidoreductase [Verrucomicrobia bacterium]|nr:Gfo/Idh/MocA family oxidoreductase [Verrucomicrobiota bacterium]